MHEELEGAVKGRLGGGKATTGLQRMTRGQCGGASRNE